MSYEITGKLIEKENTQRISEKFQKREFVLEIENERNPQWNDFIKIQLVQDRCDLIEKYKINDVIKVSFNLRGRKWEKDGKLSYFTHLEGWKIEMVSNSGAGGDEIPPVTSSDIPVVTTEDIPPLTDKDDDLPF